MACVTSILPAINEKKREESQKKKKKIEFLGVLRESDGHPFTLSDGSKLGCEWNREKEKRNG